MKKWDLYLMKCIYPKIHPIQPKNWCPTWMAVSNINVAPLYSLSLAQKVFLYLRPLIISFRTWRYSASCVTTSMKNPLCPVLYSMNIVSLTFIQGYLMLKCFANLVMVWIAKTNLIFDKGIREKTEQLLRGSYLGLYLQTEHAGLILKVIGNTNRSE